MTIHRDALRPAATVAAATMVIAAMVLLALSIRPSSAIARDDARAVVKGSLGLGAERTAPPFSYRAVDKIGPPEQPSGSQHAAMAAVAHRTATPLPPAPKPVPRAKRTSSRSIAPRTTAGAWKSARCTWYGPGFYGRRTASGMVLQPGSMIVAHRSLPFGTRIEFEYGGRRCMAIVADRGPASRSLEFDLGPGTARTLGFGGTGTVRYRFVK